MNYKYQVIQKCSDHSFVMRYCRTWKEIQDVFGITRSSQHQLLRDKPPKKYQNFTIKRIEPFADIKNN